MPLGRNKRKYLLASLMTLVVLSSFFIFAGPVLADETAQKPTEDSSVTMKTVEIVVFKPIAIVLFYVVNFLLHLIVVFAHILIGLASYNNFVNEKAITDAWMIVRDIANMFFVVVFLVIAIGTIMGAKQYHYKQTLPKLLLMAVLINFSRTICGVLIDFAQVIMLTFVNAFSQTAGGNFINGLGLNSLFAPNVDFIKEAEGGAEFFQLIFGEFLAAAVCIVAFVVMVIMTIVLLFRIIMLWLLLVISPLAFFAWAMPAGRFSGYFKTWFDDFVNNVISGPILAFFLWLALTAMSSQNIGGTIVVTGPEEGIRELSERELTVGASEMGKTSNLLKYLISIGMLIGGLIMTKKLQVIGSDMAGKAPGWMQKKATGAAKWVGRKGWQGVDDRLRIRERAATVASYLPGARGAALAYKGKVTAERAALVEKKSKDLSALGWRDKLKMARSVAPGIETADRRAQRIAAMKDMLHNKADQFKMKDDLKNELIKGGMSKDAAKAEAGKRVNTELQNLLEQYNKYGEARKDKNITGDAYKLKLDRPDLIKNEADRKKFISGMMTKDLVNISPLSASDEVTRKEIAERIGELSDYEIPRLPKEFFGEEITNAEGKKEWKARVEIPQAIIEKRTGDELDRLMRRLPEVMRQSLEEIEIPPGEFEKKAIKGELPPTIVRKKQLELKDYAKIIAQHGSAELRESILKDRDKAVAYAKGLTDFRTESFAAGRAFDPTGAKYSPEVLSASRDMLAAGVSVVQSFNADVDGSFIVTAEGDSPDRASFVEAIKSDPTIVLNIKPEEFRGDVANIVADQMQSGAVLRQLMDNAKTGDEKTTFKMVLRDVYNNVAGKTDTKSVELKDQLELSFKKLLAELKKKP